MFAIVKRDKWRFETLLNMCDVWKKVGILFTMMMFNKIAVIGAGNVGATTAQRLAEAELAKTVV